MSNWTKEPWRVVSHNGEAPQIIAGIRVIAKALYWLGSEDVEEVEANAARIVACVNACAGIDPAAIGKLVEACKAWLAIQREESTERNNWPERLAMTEDDITAALEAVEAQP
jgi:hypothetical protein